MSDRLAALIDGLQRRDAASCDRVADALHEAVGGSCRSFWSILGVPKPAAAPRPSAAFSHAARLARRDEVLRSWASVHLAGHSKCGAATHIERALRRYEQKFRAGGWRGGPVPDSLVPALVDDPARRHSAAIIGLDLKRPSVGTIRKILAKPYARPTDGQPSCPVSTHHLGGNASNE